MVKRETIIFLHNDKGERVTVCQPEDMGVYMEQNESFAYAVAVEGVHINDDNFQELRTLYIYTREDHEAARGVSFKVTK